MAKKKVERIEVANKTSKIDELTPEQEAQLSVYCNKYIKVGMSCDTHTDVAEAAIKALYKQEGYKEPEIRWFNSPYSTKKAAKEAGVADTSFGWEGSFDAMDAAFYACVREVLGCKAETEKFLPIFDIISSCGPMILCDEAVFVSHKPTYLFTDDAGELHCESGPAFRYDPLPNPKYAQFNDAFEGYYWHGFNISAWIITNPEKITVENIQSEDNAEVKRIMLERFGTGRFITEAGGVLLEEEQHEQDGHSQLWKDKLGNVMLHCGDPSTSRMYWLTLPPTVTSIKEAYAFLNGGDQPGALDRKNQVART